MTLRIITPPAVEPVTAQEAMAWARLDGGNQEPAPGAMTVALAGAGAGNVNTGAHRYLATFVTADGETQAGAVSAAVTTSAGDGKVALSAIPVGGALVTARKLYRTVAGGSAYLFLATLGNNTATTYTDDIADASLGTGAPTVNTTTDPMLGMLIAVARQVAEHRTGRALITQTWEQVLDAFPAAEIEIGMLPIQSITSVKYYDSEGVLQTMSSADYVLDMDTLPGWLLPAYDVSWPDTYAMANAVIVRFVAGYGSAGSSVPANLRMWICAQVAAAYAHPTSLILGIGNSLLSGVPAQLPFIDGLLDAYRLRWL